ncbi:MAG: hypothetical protein COU40_01935 [Candidatus Moranbacteria bacterium CG10_big_fil_rev_8_21_14_0_10_35_21]|nr:MAG: hypothetical protein COU40_01935 [Candidatus Moranbacteria bacterium CG10_big_fil_rev_8_21_14_0_10_35_21]PJA88258.1 MAG: hypothetical protein CO139_04210 [Candidatus Moranbacteria bacterium CG_4_9_14_3_um_filter_36_9]
MSSPTSKKYLKIFIKLIISLGFLIWVFLDVNWNEIFFYLQKISLGEIMVYFSIILLGMFISSYKWQILAQFRGIQSSYWNFFKLYLTGTLINNVMPSFVGGDTYRAYQIGKPEQKYTEAASSVVMDRITGFVGATILSFVFAFFNYKSVLKHDILILANVLLLLSFGIDIALAKMRRINLFKDRAKQILPLKFIAFLRDLSSYNGNSRILIRSILWGSVFSFIGVAVSNGILFWALGIKMNMLDYLSAIFLVSIISAIPISINNIGVKEWAYVTFFGVFGISSSLIITVALLSRFLQMILSFSALPIYLKNKD